MDKNNLAFFGGTPVRSKAFPSPAVVGKEEIQSVMDVFDANEFSRYAGGAADNVEELLRLTSDEANKRELDYWNFLGGKKVRRFEADFAEKFEAKYAIAVNSATTAISVALASAGVGPGDEVIVTALSFTATASAILMFGSIPKFIDVDASTFCMDPNLIEKAITNKTKAIVIVHLLGNSADMDAISEIAKKYKLLIIEDNAQGPLVKYKGRYAGTLGDLGVFSFQETKNMMTGEGSRILTDNVAYARKCRLIRNHGETVADDTYPRNDLIVGYNFRMTEMTAALGVEQLKRLEENNQHRNKNAIYLRKHLSGLTALTQPYIPEYSDYQCHIYALLYDEKKTGVSRTVIVDAIRKEGIPVGTGYVRLLYQNPIFLKKSALAETGFPFCYAENDISYKAGDCPVAEDLISNKFIWIYQVNKPADKTDMDDIVQAFKKVFTNLDALRKISPNEVELEYNR
jgi:dTDP-4-amino-4,6-dideoxygalactose transaminase